MQQQLIFSYTSYPDKSYLPLEDQELVTKALEATNLSYAPYSKFKVGAAARLANNQIILGSNQENASFGVTLCAERVLLGVVSTIAPNCRIKTIAINYISEAGNNTNAISPCGICRQALLEYQNQHNCKIRIIMTSSLGQILIVEDLAFLLPFAFSDSNLTT